MIRHSEPGRRLTMLAVAGMVLVTPAMAMAAQQTDLRQTALGEVNQSAGLTADLGPQDLAAKVGPAIGLQANEQLSLTRTSTNEAGVQNYHFDQTYKGVPIWGQRLVVSRAADGRIVRLGGTLTHESRPTWAT